MDVFKLSVSDKHGILITRKNFEHHTRERAPWYQSLNGNRESHLAVCPACNNTITIVGLHSKETEIDKETGEVKSKQEAPPHGRHYLHRALPGLGILDIEEYENCPYSGKPTLNPSSQRGTTSPIPTQIQKVLASDFDRVVYFFSRTTGIKLSIKEAERMLERYTQAEGWKYAGASVNNLPWMFGYFCRSTSLMYKRIFNESLRAAIKQRYPSANFDGNFKLVSKGAYISPCFCFLNHRRRVKDEQLEESIDLVVSDDNDSQAFYRETIVFDSIHFENLLQSTQESYRNQRLIEIGKHLFSDVD